VKHTLCGQTAGTAPKEESQLPSNQLKSLAHLEEETSNALFEELADWNEHLKGENIDFREPTP